jgi:hypothetical protein
VELLVVDVEAVSRQATLMPNAAPPVMVAIWPIRRHELVTVTERASAGMAIALRSAGAITSVAQ